MNRPIDGANGGSTVWGAGNRRLGYTIRRRIAALDAEEDHEEVARLTLEVLYGDPIAVHAALLIGFSRQVAVPSIARVIYRGGRGETLRHIARRIDDTLALFGAFLKWGPSSPEGRAAIARMEHSHARFAITDEQKLYTLATLIFEAERIGRHLGFAPFTASQRQAVWHFWRGVAKQMPLGGLPPTADELWRWMLEYEGGQWRYTDDGSRVVAQFFEDWTTRWFPRPARGLGRQILLAMMGRGLAHRSAPGESRPACPVAAAHVRPRLPASHAGSAPANRSLLDGPLRAPFLKYT